MGTCMGNKRSNHSSEEKEKEKEQKEKDQKGKSKSGANNEIKAQQPKPETLSANVPPDKPTPSAEPATKQPTSPQTKAAPKTSVPSGPKPPDLSEFTEDTRNLLLGKFAVVKCRLRPQMVRIYVSASAVDSEVERNALIERVYPKLRDYCAKKGYEFEVVDLHWGLWNSKLKDEKYLDHCIEEIKNCQAKSTGPNFLSFLNMKYDRLVCPSRILASAYDRLLKKVEDEADRELLIQHYKLDSNAVPPVYVLLDSQENNDDAELICDILRNSWSKEEKERYLASVLEMEVEEGVFCPQSQSDAVIWLHRRLSKIDANDDIAENHIDLLPDNKEIDTLSQEQLGQLTKRLAGKVNEGCFLKFDIPWSPKGLDPDGISTHAKYLDELCAKTQKMIEEMIDKAITERQEEEVMAKRIHARLYQELLHHTLLCQRHTETYSGQSQLLSQIETYLKSDKTMPLILHGDVGCGKSATAAMAAKLCDKVLPQSACVVRFVGASPESATLNRVLRSVCEQIAYLFGEHISTAAKGHKRLHKDLPKLLKRVTDQRPLVVIVDGIDQFPSTEAQSYEWIPHTLPANVKIILTTRSKDYDGFSQLQSHLQDKATFVEITPLSEGDAGEIRDNTLKSNGRTLSSEQAELLQEAIKESASPLFVQLACNAASRWHSYDSVNNESLPKDISNQFEALLQTLEERYGKTAVGHAVGYLSLARHGLSDAEMNDLLSCDDAVLDEIYDKLQPSIRRVPTFLWVALCQELGPFLLECVADNHGLRTWAHHCFRDVAIKRYISTEQLQRQFHKAFVDYFQGRWSKKKKACVKEGGIEVPMERFVLPQPSNYGRHANMRRFHELVYHAFHSGEKKFVEKYIWDVEWLGEKLQACDVYSVMEDLSLAKSKEPATNVDLELLEEFLQVSAYALSCDGAQLYTQLQQRLGTFIKKKGSSYSKMKKFIDQANPPPAMNFLPSRDCLLKVGEEDNSAEEEIPKHELSGLFRFKSNKTHMLSIATDTGKVVVWNITSQKAERTLTGITSPRDVRSVDDQRVVILCNRELRIYNLDAGTFETKLKGIMNQQMPYFSLHDKDHVVALSRNRMYVNMINVSNGEVVSTFKVGEDRFLNSLLVSANGERCVCGDETQKPSPLLVWDLGARKLIYDFRINQHEFVTKMAAISNDGHYVVSVIKELDDPTRNFVIVYDLLSGQLFKKWKPQANTTCVAISSEGLCVVNGCEDCNVLVWDLSSGSLKHTLRGHTHAVDKLYLSDDGHRCLSHDSTQRDRSVKLWDLQKGVCLATFTPDRPVSCCQISADGSCAVIGLPGEKEIITLWVRTKDSKPPKADLTPYGDASKMGQEFDLKG